MSESSNSSGKVILIVAIVVVVLLGAILGWYFLKYKPDQEAKEKARVEQLAKEEAERKRKEQEAKNKARYDQLIQEADAEYEIESWESVRAKYAEASSLFPNEAYPKSRLTLIDEKLLELAEREARRAAGIIETISTRTNLYYVIVSSSLDDDLAMDYANELLQLGEDVKVIAHEDSNHFYYRVALGAFYTQEEAEQAIDLYRSFGETVWVLSF